MTQLRGYSQICTTDMVMTHYLWWMIIITLSSIATPVVFSLDFLLVLRNGHFLRDVRR